MEVERGEVDGWLHTEGAQGQLQLRLVELRFVGRHALLPWQAPRLAVSTQFSPPPIELPLPRMREARAHCQGCIIIILLAAAAQATLDGISLTLDAASVASTGAREFISQSTSDVMRTPDSSRPSAITRPTAPPAAAAAAAAAVERVRSGVGRNQKNEQQARQLAVSSCWRLRAMRRQLRAGALKRRRRHLLPLTPARLLASQALLSGGSCGQSVLGDEARSWEGVCGRV